jgi:hypothetical protein
MVHSQRVDLLIQKINSSKLEEKVSNQIPNFFAVWKIQK